MLAEGSKHADLTQLLCPVREHTNFLEGSDHTLAVLSSDAVISIELSSENLTVLTGAVCPFRLTELPFALGIHRRIVLSLDADATTSPWGEKQTSVTGPVLTFQCNIRMIED